MNSFNKLNDLSLLSLKDWKNSLKDNQINVTNEELIQFNNMFKVFNCENLKPLFELYPTGEVLQYMTC